MNELWKQIKDWKDYEVSNYGVVKSNKSGKTAILKQYRNKSDYFRVCLINKGKKTNKAVARLVLETFVGECPNGLECSHLDGNKENNRLDNLVWENRKQNMRRRDDVKLNSLYVKWIRLLLERGWSTKVLSSEFGVTDVHILRIKNRKMWEEE